MFVYTSLIKVNFFLYLKLPWASKVVDQSVVKRTMIDPYGLVFASTKTLVKCWKSHSLHCKPKLYFFY